jgi:hypothetical protein
MKEPAGPIAIAHRVLAHEEFDQTAYILLKLLNNAQRKFPGTNRSLFLEIDGHRKPNGDFDDDMLELQTKFMDEFLLQFLTRVVTPVAEFKNPNPQNDVIPTELHLVRVDRPPPPDGSGESGAKRRF